LKFELLGFRVGAEGVLALLLARQLMAQAANSHSSQLWLRCNNIVRRTECRQVRQPGPPPELHSRRVVWQVMHSASNIVFGSSLSASKARDWSWSRTEGIGMPFLAGLGTDEGGPGAPR
jgi:hypothetical protein